MKPRRKILWLVTAIAALAILSYWIFFRVPDPVYKGRKLSAWFHILTPPNQPSLQFSTSEFREAEAAINALGPEAVPFLRSKLFVGRSWWNRSYQKFYSERAPKWLRPRLPVPTDTKAPIRHTALMALFRMGKSAAPAAKDLALIIADDNYGPSFVAHSVLNTLGPSAHEALPILVSTLRTSSMSYLDTEALIPRIARSPADVVPLIAPLLQDKDRTKVRALKILVQLNSASRVLEREIEGLHRSTNNAVRFAAVSATWKIFPEKRLSLFPQLRDLAAGNTNFYPETGLMLMQLPLTPEVADTLTEMTRKTSPSYRWGIYSALGKKGLSASNAVPCLLEAMTNRDEPRIVAMAASTLAAVSTGDPTVITALEEAQQSKEAMVRDAANDALLKLRPQQK